MSSQVIESMTKRLAAARLQLMAQLKVIDEQESHVVKIAEAHKAFDADLQSLASSIEENLHSVGAIVNGVQTPGTNGTLIGVGRSPDTAVNVKDRVREFIAQYAKNTHGVKSRKDIEAAMLHSLPPSKYDKHYLLQCLAVALQEQVKNRGLRRISKGQYELTGSNGAATSNGQAQKKGRDPSTYIAVVSGNMPSLRDCIIKVFGPPSRRRIIPDVGVVAEEVLKLGYKSSASNFRNTVNSMMTKMRMDGELEHYRDGWSRTSQM